jgi:integrase
MRTHLKGSIEKRGSAFRAIYWRNGSRVTATFRTEREARAWLLDLNNEVEPLVGAELADACAALRSLQDGVTLLDCVDFYNDHHTASSTTPLAAIVDCFLEDKRTELRQTTYAGYKRILSHIAEAFTSISDITTEAIRDYVSTLTAHAKNTHLRILSSFFGWAIDRGYANLNPCAKIKLSRTEAPRRQVLSIEDTQTLINATATHDPMLMPYISICLFAGVRPDECKQLTRADVNGDYILIGERIAKTHAARTIPIHDNLRAILKHYPISTRGILGGLSRDRFKKRLTALIKTAGIEWANDIMRHSYASYEYELTKDAAHTAANLGHPDTTMLFRHYRGLVPPRSGHQYFGVIPSTLPKK